jgi:hypothetical protein
MVVTIAYNDLCAVCWYIALVLYKPNQDNLNGKPCVGKGTLYRSRGMQVHSWEMFVTGVGNCGMCGVMHGHVMPK